MNKTILRKLAVERCQSNLSHIAALTHLQNNDAHQQQCQYHVSGESGVYNAVNALRADLSLLEDLAEE